MPGVSFRGDPGALTEGEAALATRLESHVRFLAEEVGPRSIDDPDAREKALQWLEEQVAAFGISAERESFEVFGMFDEEAGEGDWQNLVIRLPAADPDASVIVLSAHFDTVPDSPGADDDASGVAALLEIAGALARAPLADQAHTVELIFFDGEEAGVLRMGSGAHARALFESGAEVEVAISLEMLGYFTAEPDSQTFPAPFLGEWYPSQGDFLAFVGNRTAEPAIHEVIRRFREVAKVPSEGLAAPDSVKDVGRSDHAAFWEYGWPGLMITDTANFRNVNYHTESDLPETLDFERLARITLALEQVVRGLAADQ